MASEVFGWTGKILKVDLTEKAVTDLNTMDYADKYLGGRGIATKIYWDEVPPEVGAFDPENRLIFMSGPLAATGAQGASRFEVVGKSPMTIPEGFCYGNMGGFFAPFLKKAGYDGIVVFGRAESPCYIWINDGQVEIKDAASLWGKGVYQVRDILKDVHGAKIRFVAAGPAGENMVRSAVVVTDHQGTGTGGFGAVMGSKNLKAIAVLGTGNPAVARPKELTELNKYTIKVSQRGTLRMPLPKQHVKYIGKASCFQCGLDCIRGRFKTVSGKEVIRKCQSLVFYMPYAMSRQDTEIEDALDATDICNDYGLCTMEVGGIIQWLESCYQAGVLSDDDTGLEFAKLGTRQFMVDLVGMISRREGFGDVLAEGMIRAGEKLGPEAQAHFPDGMSAVGMGNSYSPREYPTNAMMYALEPRQPIAMLHEVSYMIARWLLHQIRAELSPTTAEVFRNAATRFWGSDKAWDLTNYDGKALAASIIMDRTIVKDSLALCDASWPMMDSFNTPDNIGDPALESKLFTAVTGIETDEKELLLYGERICNLQRAVLLREGWKALEDDEPAEFNFTDPKDSDGLNPKLIVPGPTEEPVSIKGRILERDKFEQMRKEFYEIRGWDTETALQKSETLAKLGMADVAGELKNLNLIQD